MSPIKAAEAQQLDGPRVWGRKKKRKQVARNDPDVWNTQELSSRHISTLQLSKELSVALLPRFGFEED